jgi:glycerate kinase
VAGVALACREASVRCIVIAGSIDPEMKPEDLPVTSSFALVDGTITSDEAMLRAQPLIADLAENIIQLFQNNYWPKSS